MIFTNLKTAWRNLIKNKLVSSINIFGLTLGLASSFLAILFAIHELTYEDLHKKADRIGTLYLSGLFDMEDKGEQKMPLSFGPEGQTLKDMFPEIESYTLSRRTNAIVRIADNLFEQENILLADSNFFSVFTIPFVTGSPSNHPQSVVLSQKTAEKYFGTYSPTGQHISVDFYGEKLDLQVTGVYKDLPSNTHIKADMIVPFKLADRFGFWKYKEYESTDYATYLLLQENSDFQELNYKILSSFKVPVAYGDGEGFKTFMVPLKKMHLSGSFDYNRGKLFIFLIGGIFVLLTSCFNYINLTNIIFSTRAKEIGIRKSNGGNRASIFFLFLSESLLATLLAFVGAVILIQVSLPWFNSIMDTHISLVSGWQLTVAGSVLFLLTVILSGIYPSLKYSSVKPTNLIQAAHFVNTEKGFSRTMITAFQFFMAVLFIQILMVMNKQTAYMNDEEVIGYYPENVICVPGYNWGDLTKVKDELLKNPNIEKVSWGSTIPSMSMSITKSWITENNSIFATKFSFEKDYFDVYQIKMIQGRFFSDEFADKENSSIVINQKAAEILGHTNPIDKMVWVEGKQHRIIGIVDNYLAQPPIFDYMPMLVRPSENQNSMLVMRISPRDRQATHQFIASTLQQFNPEYPVSIRYNDEILFDQDEAKSFISAGQLMNLFFSLTIITSIIGLFGLSVFLAERGKKAIGVRKVLGASSAQIVYVLSKGVFMRMCIAAALATPIAILAAGGYLSVFPINFKPGLFFYLIGAGIGIFVLFITIAWQVYQSARKNPVEALRYE